MKPILIERINRITAILTAVLIAAAMFSCFYTASAATVKKPAKVKLTSVKASGLKITLKWKKAKNAKKYQVYVKAGAAKWKLRKTLKKTSLSITGKSGETYSFKVRGLNGKKKGAFSAVKKVSIPKEKHEDEIDGEIRILEEPEMQVAKDGEEVTFSVKAEGRNLVYQWYVTDSETGSGGRKIARADSPEYTLTASAANKGAFYYCVISNNSRSRKTRPVELEVLLENHVYITEQPASVNVYEGETAAFNIDAIGTGECFYQWYRNDTDSNTGGTELTGEVMQRFSLDARLSDDDSYYYCVVRDEVSVMRSDCVKLDVEINPARGALVRELESFIEKNGLLSPETISIDGHGFYVLAEEEEMVLILADEPWRRNDHLTALYQRWNDDTAQGNTRMQLNGQYLRSLPTLKYMAKEVTNITPGDIENGEYYETRDKVFVLTEADVTGSYDRVMGETLVKDFTFDRTEEHIGRALPPEIAQLRNEDGDLVTWWVRTPSSIDYRWGSTVFCNPTWVSYQDDGSIQMNIIKDWPPYIRPAMWVDLSIR